MKYFIKQHIHSSFACLSSNDIYVKREITEDDFNRLALDLESTINEKYGFAVVYAKPDDRYGKVQHFLNPISKEKLNQYVEEAYLSDGWQLKIWDLDNGLSQHWADKRKAEIERRRKEGYVIPEWSKDLPPESYQGGFSDEIFFNPELYDYVKSGGVWGFIGHSVRKPLLDKYFEKVFLKTRNDQNLLAMWLTSTGGRHFGDSLEDKTFAEQKDYIDKSIAGIIEQAESYLPPKQGDLMWWYVKNPPSKSRRFRVKSPEEAIEAINREAQRQLKDPKVFANAFGLVEYDEKGFESDGEIEHWGGVVSPRTRL